MSKIHFATIEPSNQIGAKTQLTFYEAKGMR